ITPFRQYLQVSQRTIAAGETSPFNSFSTLFAESPSIDMLVSLGNFQTIKSWTFTLANQHPELNLPLEQFFQDALFKITPYSARNYDGSIGNPFFNYLVNLLKKRFSDFTQRYQREITTPIHIEGDTLAR